MHKDHTYITELSSAATGWWGDFAGPHRRAQEVRDQRGAAPGQCPRAEVRELSRR
jgi:hypothetical protein